MLDLIESNIPQELKEKPQWVGIKIIEGGKKVPIDPNFNHDLQWAKINDPTTWGSFQNAAKLVERGECVAVAYALTKEDKIIFVDLDCHTETCSTEEEKKKVEQFYKALCKSTEAIETYREKSLSGNGVHFLAKGELLPGYKTGGSKVAPVELYTHNRFVIMTGHKENDCEVSDEEKVIGSIRNLQKQFFTKKAIQGRIAVTKPAVPIATDPLYTDEQVLEVALRDAKFQMLWENRWDEVKNKDGSPTYTQQHYADFALVKKLAYYTGNNPEQIERLFKASPTYQAYGQNGKWRKFEADIAKDIKTATSTCTAIYTPIPNRKITPVSDTGIEVVQGEPTAFWKPDFPTLYKSISEDEDGELFKDPILKSVLKDYIIKYQDRPNIQYIPYLFSEDKNVNGATAIVKRVLGDNLKYSRKLGGYFIWNGKQYVNYGDEETLIHPLSEVLGLVEHSVFLWTMDEVANADGDKELSKGVTVKSLMEEKALKLFNRSKGYVEVKLVRDVLKKYKGMDVANDICTYYESPFLNMQNGVLNLTTRELLPHKPAFNQYKITNCDYDPNATCPEFQAMLDRVLPNKDDQKSINMAFGLCLAKQHLPAKKVLMLAVGPSNGGKTTLINTIADVLGEYATAIDNSLLMQSKVNKTRGPEMLDFIDTLLISTSETNSGDKLDTAKIKALTGETTLSFRNNFATSMIKCKNVGIIWIDSNYKPFLNANDVLWDRLRLFPFLHPITQKDPDLKAKLALEKPGIFNWLLRGLDMVLEEKEIPETPAMIAFKQGYQEEMDTVGQFFTDCIEETESKGDKIQTSILFSTYKNWCKDNGFFDSVRTKFYEECGKRFEKKKSGVEYFTKLKFTPLGVLYCGMAEKTPQQFAKAKRMLLQGETTDITYKVARDLYFEKSWGWFVQNIRPEQQYHNFDSLYYKYNDWCIDYGLVPIKSIDFNTKLSYMFQHMNTRTPDADLLDQVKNIWHDNS